jgi:hypothetical protein
MLCIALPAFGQKVEAKLHCKPTDTDFTYDCMINLTRGGEPLSGAQITLGADMPSMPMAHQVKPAKAKPGKKPGDYHARLELEMQGEWAVKLRVSGPVRDQLIVHYNFTESGTAPRK